MQQQTQTYPQKQQMQSHPQEQLSSLAIGDPIKNLLQPEQENQKQTWPWSKILLIIISVLSITGSVTFGTLYALNTKITDQPNPSHFDLPTSVSLGRLTPNLGQILMTSLQLEQEQWIALVHSTNLKKTELTEPMTQSVMSQSQSSTNQLQYIQYIALEPFLGTFNFSTERVDSIVRLKQYFRESPTNAMENLVNEAKIRLEYPFSYDKNGNKVMDQLKIVSIVPLTEIELTYDISDQKLQPTLVSQFSYNRWEIGGNQNNGSNQSGHNNLQSQAETPDYLSDPSFNNLFIRVMGNTIWEMKQLAMRSVNFWNMEKTQELVKYQQSKANTVDNVDEWKQVLTSDCRTVESMKFRCSINAAYKLVPELTVEHVKANQDKYLISNTLKLVFQKSYQN